MSVMFAAGNVNDMHTYLRIHARSDGIAEGSSPNLKLGLRNRECKSAASSLDGQIPKQNGRSCGNESRLGSSSSNDDERIIKKSGRCFGKDSAISLLDESRKQGKLSADEDDDKEYLNWLSG